MKSSKYIITRLHEKIRRELILEKSTGLPRVIVWENTNKCNLNCNICYRFGKSVDFVEFDRDYFSENLLNIFKEIQKLELSISGEPFLYSGFHELCRSIRGSEINISAFTNGTTLSPDNIEFITDLFSQIHISMDAFSDETYRKIRKTEFIRILNNVLKLAKRSEEKKSKLRIFIDFVIMYSNYRELIPLIKELMQYGIKDFEVSHLVLFNPALSGETMFNHKKEYNTLYNEIINLSKTYNLNILMPPMFTEEKPNSSDQKKEKSGGSQPAEIQEDKKVFKNCPLLWYKTWIDIKGDVLSCCHPVPVKMGNLGFESLENIWNGEKYKKLRMGFKTGDLPPSCLNCNLISHRYNKFTDMNHMMGEVEKGKSTVIVHLEDIRKSLSIKYSKKELKVFNIDSPLDSFIIFTLFSKGKKEIKRSAYWQVPVRLLNGENIILISGDYPNYKFFVRGEKAYPVVFWKRNMKPLSNPDLSIEIRDWETDSFLMNITDLKL